MMNEKLTQGTNKGTLIGILNEKKLELIDSFVPNTSPRVSCKTIRGHIIVSTDNGDFRIEVYQNSKTKTGVDNKMYTAVETLYTDYISKVDASKNSALTADVISVRVQADVNDYYNDKAKKMVSGIRFKFNGCSRTNDTELTTGLDLQGFIWSVKPELKDEEETGRVLVQFINFGYEEKALPFILVVSKANNEKWFDDNFKAGSSVELKIQPTYVSVGAKKQKVAYGEDVKTSDGYDVLELLVSGAYEIIEDEENEFFYDSKRVKEAMKERKVLLEQIEADGKKGKKPAVKAKVSAQEATDAFDEDETPF